MTSIIQSWESKDRVDILKENTMYTLQVQLNPAKEFSTELSK